MTRGLFLAFCILSGLAAGLWFSYSETFIGHDSTTVISPAADSAEISPGTEPAPAASPIQSDAENRQTDTKQLADAPSPSITDKLRPDTLQSSSAAMTKDAPSTVTAPLSYYDGIMKVAPSVVSVYANSDAANTAERGESSQGSGVIVERNGVILTNLHLVEGFESITVVLSNGRQYPAILIGSDQETDLAVVKIAESNLPFVRIDEAPPLRVGDIVLAIGNPYNVGQTVTQGIVSATSRRVAGGTAWQNFVQIDAAINPGNSGGALVNPLGQLVGVNTAVFRGETGAIGIGYSIPSELLVQVVPQIIENGFVARGWLGIGVDDLTKYPDLRTKAIQGAVITDVLNNSPASHGGLQYLDVVTGLGEQPIRSARELLLQVSNLPPGATVKLVLLRQKNIMDDSNEPVQLEEIMLKMRLGKRPLPKSRPLP